MPLPSFTTSNNKREQLQPPSLLAALALAKTLQIKQVQFTPQNLTSNRPS